MNGCANAHCSGDTHRQETGQERHAARSSGNPPPTILCGMNTRQQSHEHECSRCQTHRSQATGLAYPHPPQYKMGRSTPVPAPHVRCHNKSQRSCRPLCTHHTHTRRTECVSLTNSRTLAPGHTQASQGSRASATSRTARQPTPPTAGWRLASVFDGPLRQLLLVGRHRLDILSTTSVCDHNWVTADTGAAQSQATWHSLPAHAPETHRTLPATRGWFRMGGFL